MIEFFEAMQFWHWILLAIVLIAGEALGAAGFLLGAVMASLELALITYIWPDLTWQQQISCLLWAFTAFILAASVQFQSFCSALSLFYQKQKQKKTAEQLSLYLTDLFFI